jgi:thiol-disulfide isomerase/thioredoxin
MPAMKKNWKILALIAALLAVWAGMMLKNWHAGHIVLSDKFDPALPTLMELGTSWCPGCRAMKPVMKDLQDNYGGFNVKYVDVEANDAEAARYAVDVIPLIVFVSQDGTALYKHEGTMSKADILAKWKELGTESKKGDR